jgi:hypothetical protein
MDEYMKTYLAVFIVLVGISTYFIIKYLRGTYKQVATKDNIEQVKQEQLALMEKQYLGRVRKDWNGSQISKIPAQEQLLINSAVFSARNAGFVGPTDGGVFDEDAAVRIACDTGVRFFTIEIEMSNDHQTPVLVAGDGVRALNKGSLDALGAAFAKYAFRGREDPLILYVHARTAPNMGTEPKNYITFCSKVAKAFKGLRSKFLASSPVGSYGRQGLEGRLFYMPVKDLGSSVIFMTDLDTSIFRKTGDYGMKVAADEDLDLCTHVRVYTEGQQLKKKPAAFAASADYWLATPANIIKDAQDKTKESFSIVLSGELTEKKYVDLLNVFGVQAVCVPLYEMAAYAVGIGSALYRDSWLAKKDALRYKPAAPIVVKTPSAKLDSNGGRLVAPKV